MDISLISHSYHALIPPIHPSQTLNLAVEELMASAKKPKSTTTTTSPTGSKPSSAPALWSNLLLGYVKDPASHPDVLYFDDDFVLIQDKYPKVSVIELVLATPI